MRKKLLSVKELLQLPAEFQPFAALYGTDLDPRDAGFVYFWGIAVDMGQPAKHAAAMSEGGQLREYFVTKLEPRITDAFKTGDATFLRKLADAIESRKRPFDLVRHVIALMALCQKENRDVEGGWNRTASEWCAEIGKQCGRELDLVVFRRMAKEMGLKLAPDKRGRKPTQKLKLKKANRVSINQS
jgi:hypothetical protein